MAPDRRFRFGVQTSGAGSRREWQEKARKIEALGYSTLYMPDHFIETLHAPMVGIAMAAEATASLRIGTLVLGNDYKHPAVVAKGSRRSTCCPTAGSKPVSAPAG
jgi:alkanesulfonate monooxygenase SsuD/methylene tetrahydromethanopterin reductase-like flavin-dependent oxidoreductase (luciferase family)